MVNINHRLKYNRYHLDREAHIQVNGEKCRTCPHQVCLTSCPAQCYLPDSGSGVVFNYEGCLECGTCYLLCDQKALTWNYPRGGCGLSLRYS